MFEIEFHEEKNHKNLEKHAVSLLDAGDFVMESAFVEPDTRHAYGEERFIATGYLRERVQPLVFTLRGTRMRVISLRKANLREHGLMQKKHTIEYEDGRIVELDEDDAPELTEAALARMRPAREVLPEAFLKAIADGRVGRPKAVCAKRQVSLRLDEDILAAFRATGRGWQSRVNAILRNAMPQ